MSDVWDRTRAFKRGGDYEFLLMVASDMERADGVAVKVIDFGLAKAVAETEDMSAEPLARFSGTPGFASPEQLQPGSKDKPLDIRSDSLGVTVWYLLCGKTPFAGRTLKDVREEQHQGLPFEQLSSRKVPAPVIDLLRSILATNPAARPQSARELSAQLRRCREKIGSPRRRELLELAAVALLLMSALG